METPKKHRGLYSSLYVKNEDPYVSLFLTIASCPPSFPRDGWQSLKTFFNVLKMLRTKGKITTDLIALMDKWRHSGFNALCGSRIFPGHKSSMV